MILTCGLDSFEATLRNGVLMKRLAISAPAATTTVAAAAGSTRIATTAAWTAAGTAKSARIAATCAAATLTLVQPLPREGIRADVAK